MLTNGEEKSLCDRRDELVSYLYAEMPEDQRTRLEAHLLDCTACTDEFAGLSEARFSVFEWQKEEFAPLATPEFTIPYEKAAVAAVPEKSAAAGFGLRSLITFGWPAFAMASLALVAAGSIALWIFASGSGTSQDLAKNTNVEKSTPVAAPAQVAPVVKEEQKAEVAVKEAPRPVSTVARDRSRSGVYDTREGGGPFRISSTCLISRPTRRSFLPESNLCGHRR